MWESRSTLSVFTQFDRNFCRVKTYMKSSGKQIKIREKTNLISTICKKKRNKFVVDLNQNLIKTS